MEDPDGSAQARPVRRKRPRAKSPEQRLEPSSVSLVFPEGAAACPKGHAYERRTKNPPGYRQAACCDLCGLPELPRQRGDFFHCGLCKFDQCPECLAVAVRYELQSGGCIELRQDMSAAMAAAQRYDARVWTSAPALARHLEEMQPPPSGCVLELGCGSALCAQLLAKLPETNLKAVFATDLPGSLGLAAQSVRRNFPEATEASEGGFRCQGRQLLLRGLDWKCGEAGVRELREEAGRAGLPAPGLVLAADVVYIDELVAPLLDTLAALRSLWLAPGAKLLMAWERRGVGCDRLLIRGLRARNMASRRLECSQAVRAEGRGRVEILCVDLCEAQ